MRQAAVEIAICPCSITPNSEVQGVFVKAVSAAATPAAVAERLRSDVAVIVQARRPCSLV